MAQTDFRTRSAFYRHTTARTRRTQRAEMPLFQAFLRPSPAKVTDGLCIKDVTTIDPACGSGNFLTETYLCLRKLEDSVLSEVRKAGLAGQMQMTDSTEEERGERISLAQFHGIEINDFAVSVAETALYISRLKANADTMMLLDVDSGDLPLKESAHIVLGNALRMDWNDVVPAEECDFIMGNPPFVGHQWRTKEQQKDMDDIFCDVHGYGKLDYVCAWYGKTVPYIANTNIQCAYVSTNSICQGESVSVLWKFLKSKNIGIEFAYRTFVWDSETVDKAHVHCVIVGFSNNNSRSSKLLFQNDRMEKVNHINGYLLPAPDIFLENRNKKFNEHLPPMTKGSQPTDGGFLILSTEEKHELLNRYPELDEIIKDYIGSVEFINNKKRYCLWFADKNPSDYTYIPEITDRFNNISEMRKQSPTKSVQKDARTPHLFTQNRQPSTNYLVVPEVSSQTRQYIPMGFLSPDVICNNRLRIIPNGSLYMFGILISNSHMAWTRVVSGRLKSDYCYQPFVYNNFPWPNPTGAQKAKIESCAQAVLDARDNHPGDSLATLYDPDKMPADLLAAHKALDKAVEEAYGVEFDGDEEKIVAHLFKLYQEKVEELEEPKEKAPEKPKPAKTIVKVKIRKDKGAKP